MSLDSVRYNRLHCIAYSTACSSFNMTPVRSCTAHAKHGATVAHCKASLPPVLVEMTLQLTSWSYCIYHKVPVATLLSSEVM